MARTSGKGFSGSMQLKGAKALQRKLNMLPKRVANKIVRQALRAGAKAIQAKAKELAPVDSGTLRKSIKVRAAKSRKGKIAMRVVSGAGDFKGDTYYGAFVEYGYRRGKRKRAKGIIDDRSIVPARPYMRPAFDSTKDLANAIIKAHLASKIAEAAKAP